MNLQNKKIAIIGLGVTGIASLCYLLARGAQISVRDKDDSQEIQDKISDISNGKEVDVLLGKDYLSGLNQYDFVVLAPGIDPRTPEIAKLKEAGIPIHNDVTLFLEEWSGRGPTIGVTGSNGKSTTVSIIYELLKANNIPAKLGGNIGVSPLDWLLGDMQDGTVIVLEVSSFLLEHFRDEHFFNTFILLNISNNHLDRHGNNLEEYTLAKLHGITDPHTQFIISNDNEDFYKSISQASGSNNIFPISTHSTKDAGVFINEKGKVVFGDRIMLSDIENRKILGEHNKEDIVFALAAITSLNTTTENNNKAISEFAGLPHRTEFIAEKDGVVYINDSKSTSPDATAKALSAYANGKNVVLIAGGQDKGADFESLVGDFKKYVKALILLPGEASAKIESLAKGNVENVVHAENMQGAVAEARNLASLGDIVLLSPACASKNIFKSFEDRGDQFRKIAIAFLN